MILKTHKTQVSEYRRLRNLKFKPFQVSIIKISMIDTYKFTSLGKAWNNLYAGCNQGVASTLVLQPLLEDERRVKCGVVVGGS